MNLRNGNQVRQIDQFQKYPDVHLSQALSPTAQQPYGGGVFSPLISPKNNDQAHQEHSPQPVMIGDIDGEPHYSQVVDGMHVKRNSSTTYQVSLACGPLQKKRYIN